MLSRALNMCCWYVSLERSQVRYVYEINRVSYFKWTCVNTSQKLYYLHVFIGYRCHWLGNSRDK